MKYYIIKVPYLSQGLKRSYNKQLEVYEMETGENYPMQFLNTCGIHEFKGGKWVYRKSTKTLSVSLKGKVVQTEIVNSSSSIELIFEDLELAKVSKFLLLDDLKKTYKKEINKIVKLMERNIPDVSIEIEKIKENYPEHFI